MKSWEEFRPGLIAAIARDEHCTVAEIEAQIAAAEDELHQRITERQVTDMRDLFIWDAELGVS